MSNSRPIKTDGRWFKDHSGRTLLLRGVNLAGSSKVPRLPNGATWNQEHFLDHRNVSFVGRPFPLEEADAHFSRLRRWGLTFLRFLVTWEAIEHAGPGLYDEAYLDYLYAVIKKAGEYDLQLFIDPHQDVWSRFTGGDGAPGWTLEAVGMDLTKLSVTGAALTHQQHGDPFPAMIWLSNYGKFGCATMWTLFFGGNDFAPQTTVDGLPIQEYLQSHYLNAIKQVALRLKGLSHVVGYDTLNEPSTGYIGYALDDWPTKLFRNGQAPTIIEGMLLAAGQPREIEYWKLGVLGFRKNGSHLVNSEGVSLWHEGFEPIWKQNGVWDIDRRGNTTALRPDHFQTVRGRTVGFDRDYFRPFVERYVTELRSVDPEAIIFVDPAPAVFKDGHPDYALPGLDRIVHAPHWYDGFTLGSQWYLPWLGISADGKKFRPVVGRARVRRSYAKQIRQLVDYSDEDFKGIPTLIGETGIPFNINNQKAYRTGNFAAQVAAMDDTIQALEANLISYTLWNYTPDNTNRHGDQWNGEDLSIFSRDQQTGSNDMYDGGRALEAVLRPYAAKVPGRPLHMSFDLKTKVFRFEFRLDPAIEAPAEFFVPDYHYPDGYQVEAQHGRYEIVQAEQKLVYYPRAEHPDHSISLRSRL